MPLVDVLDSKTNFAETARAWPPYMGEGSRARHETYLISSHSDRLNSIIQNSSFGFIHWIDCSLWENASRLHIENVGYRGLFVIRRALFTVMRMIQFVYLTVRHDLGQLGSNRLHEEKEALDMASIFFISLKEAFYLVHHKVLVKFCSSVSQRRPKEW